ncbi:MULTISPECIES: DUF6266 family protein [Sphingobacterium]|uniref:DUF6266 family protein n=1 Tax=Sphingobacterium TaxID=28453 RepID=UPI00038A1ECF|nr:DUF6266 family protein [Sphingobacterium sp. IITKGP-BTPF85]KKX51134.1 hypothetical protein L950_0206380 [Sphingobacterium sp. IITKGP-BTPF85]
MLVISNKKETKSQPNKVKSIQLGFKVVRYFLNPLNLLIQIGFATRKKGKTALGRAMSHHLCNALTGEYPDITIDPAKAKISEGTLAQVLLDKVERGGDFITLKWHLPGRFFPDHSNWDDELVLCAYDVEAGNAAINEQQVIRKDACMMLELPSVLKGKQVHLYLMLHDRDKRKVSRSEYLGKY